MHTYHFEVLIEFHSTCNETVLCLLAVKYIYMHAVNIDRTHYL